eukprot:TRINITY_DN512_c1_g2_i1.p1 TRINITY_DN512_c1_g2~~TRINITY_DN512_c1_g2_i1.p1  ORF type:complete len:307 (+),score=60.48 TRINITY_DN512_c1_g2_i1:546-1466(+)
MEPAAKRSRSSGMGPPSKPAEAPPSPETAAATALFPMTLDDELRAVMAMVSEYCRKDNAEIEVRLGWLVDCHSRKRIKPMWAKSSVIVTDPNVVFDARVSEQSFFKINQEMNKIVEQMGSTRGSSYKKSKTLDLFTANNDRFMLDHATHKLLSAVSKQSFQTIDIHNPRQALDLRFKAAAETPVEPPSDPTSVDFLKKVTMIRSKERRSYTVDCFTFELTTAKEYTSPVGFTSLDLSSAKKKQKLEIEVEIHIDKFKAEKVRAAAGSVEGRLRFYELCRLFIDNVRGLTETASAVVAPNLPPLKLE